ncbi:hypothetical protein KR222_009840 [Zaprionus bogoriensis]|nr:hypothetical protein KR222_009840 [Zaprionus bogoriensis]
MPQWRMRKMQLRAAELVREFHESQLMLTMGLLLQWNQWHIIRILNASRLPDELPEQQPLSWSTIFFSCGLLLTLLQYRPDCLRRRALILRKLFFLLELFVVLFLVDFILLAMWQPFFLIVDQALHTLGHSEWVWVRVLFRYCPGLSVWLLNDAFYFIRFVSSLIWFLLAIETATPKWRLAIDFLVLGQLPETIGVRRCRRKRVKHVHS